jgi:hypothetical protein
MGKAPSLKENFRPKHAKPHKRSGGKGYYGQMIGRISIDEWPKIVRRQVPQWQLGERYH